MNICNSKIAKVMWIIVNQNDPTRIKKKGQKSDALFDVAFILFFIFWEVLMWLFWLHGIEIVFYSLAIIMSPFVSYHMHVKRRCFSHFSIISTTGSVTVVRVSYMKFLSSFVQSSNHVAESIAWHIRFTDGFYKF